MSVAKNYIYLIFGRSFGYVIPIVILPIYASALGVSSFGELVLYQSIAVWLSLFIEYGFSLSGPRDLVRGVKKDIFREIGSSKILLALLLVFLFIVLNSVVDIRDLGMKQDILVFAVIHGVLTGLSPLWYFHGVGRLGVASIAELAFRLLGVLLPIAWIYKFPSVESVVFSQAFFQLCSVVVLYYFASRDGVLLSLRSVISRETKQRLLKDVRLFVFRAATSLYTTLNPLFVALILGNEKLALFSIVDRIVRGGVSFVLPLSQALYPKSSEVALGGVNENSITFYKKTLLITIFLSIAVFLLIVLFGYFFVTAFFGEEFVSAVYLLPWFSLFIIIVALNNFVGTQILLPFDQERGFSSSVLSGAVVNLSLIYPLSMMFGVVGSVASIVLSELAVLVHMLVVGKVVIREIFYIKK